MTGTFRNDEYCVVCGKKNPIGLQLDIEKEGTGEAWARLTLPKEFQGYREVAHGGIVVTLLDEMMVHALWAKGVPNVTARISVRFRKPVPVEAPLFVHGKVTGRKGKMFIAKSTLKDSKGMILAEAESLLAPFSHREK